MNGPTVDLGGRLDSTPRSVRRESSSAIERVCGMFCLAGRAVMVICHGTDWEIRVDSGKGDGVFDWKVGATLEEAALLALDIEDEEGGTT